MDRFQNVTVLTKANVYFGGKVSSHTILFADGSRKTLGVVLPGQYEFGTVEREQNEVLSGELRVLLPGSQTWTVCGVGDIFELPKNSKFQVAADVVSEYCCTYFAG
jgi:purine/pyrimidine-nucleoside phosphorylase